MKDISHAKLLEIAEEFGTPVYVYHGEKIVNQYQRLKGAFPGVNVHLHYALKALNNINILKLLKQQGAGLDAVSIQEVQLGLRAGYLPAEIMYTPNGVSFEEIEKKVTEKNSLIDFTEKDRKKYNLQELNKNIYCCDCEKK